MKFGHLTWLVLAASLTAPALAAPLAHTQVEQGKITGRVSGTVSAYLGIPYAAPPVGALRWRAPEPAAKWQGQRQATAYGADCMQVITPNGHGPWTWEYSAQGPVSENCLFVNVWTPAASATEKLPVLFWIHGGGYIEGSSSIAIYDGAKLAAKGVIVVSINYRLGSLGFLAHPALSAESADHVSGNYGVLDTIAALNWVKRNIAAFGGDPARVTIWGQSAGAGMVTNLMFAPKAKGLFAGAIAESGVGGGLALNGLKDAEAAGAEFAAAMGAKTAAELRALPADRLLNQAVPQANAPRRVRWFAPFVDGAVIPDQHENLTAAGRFNATPVLTGLTADENSPMFPKFGAMTAEECSAAFARLTRPMEAEFRAEYLKPDTDCNAAVKVLLRDRGLAGTYLWTSKRLQASSQPVFVYLYRHAEPGTDAARYGSFHSADITYVFQSLDKTPERPFTGKDREISSQVSDYWINFVKTGNPNGSALPQWPAADLTAQMLMETGDDLHARPALPPEKRKLMEEFIRRGGMVGMF